MPLLCPNPICRTPIPGHVRNCPACDTDVGYPNVRALETSEERIALDAREQAVLRNAASRGVLPLVEAFRNATGRSQAVMARSFGALNALVQSDSALYATYYQQVREGSRLPESNHWDQARIVADTIIFPYFHEHIRFAALSLDNLGPIGYGEYSITLREDMIASRSTVMEYNSTRFAVDRRLVAGEVVPLGVRALWPDRGSLATAKLGDRITPSTPSEDFARVLLDNTDVTNPDFVEVHVYGSLNRRTIDAVRGPRPASRSERALAATMTTKLAEIGVLLELT